MTNTENNNERGIKSIDITDIVKPLKLKNKTADGYAVYENKKLRIEYVICPDGVLALYINGDRVDESRPCSGIDSLKNMHQQYKQLIMSAIDKTQLLKRIERLERALHMRTQHIVNKGDTLSSIALLYYGESNQWQAIYRANKHIIGNNPDYLNVGQVLILPRI